MPVILIRIKKYLWQFSKVMDSLYIYFLKLWKLVYSSRVISLLGYAFESTM